MQFKQKLSRHAKGPILEGAVERMRDWGSFLQHCQLLALVLGADERAGGGQAADTVAVGVGKLQRFRRDDRCNGLVLFQGHNSNTLAVAGGLGSDLRRVDQQHPASAGADGSSVSSGRKSSFASGSLSE